MRELDYESLVFWDVLLFPTLGVFAAFLFGITCHFDSANARHRSALKLLYRTASISFYLAAISLAVVTAIDLYVVSYALVGSEPRSLLFLLCRFVKILSIVCGILGCIALFFAVLTRLRNSDGEVKKSSD